MSAETNLPNEVTLTVKLSDQDYDDLERWAKLTHAKSGLADGTIGGLLKVILNPAEQIAHFLTNCRREEVEVYKRAGLPLPTRRP